MSTVTAERPSKPRKVLVRFPCKFNKANANLGDHVAALAFSVPREHLTSVAAEECFCGHRVNVRLTLGEGNPDQKTFWEGVQDDVQAVALVKCFRVSPKIISSTLLFQMDGLDTEILGKFAKKNGWLFVLNAEAIDNEEEEPEQEGDDNEEEGDPDTE